MTKLDEVIRILAAETGDYVNSDNVDDILQCMIDRKNSDLDDLKEDIEFLVTGECEPDNPTWEKYVRPNLFISWAYLHEFMRMAKNIRDNPIETENDNDVALGFSLNPFEDSASCMLDVPLSEYLEKYNNNPDAALKRLKEVTDQINSSSNDN